MPFYNPTPTINFNYQAAKPKQSIGEIYLDATKKWEEEEAKKQKRDLEMKQAEIGLETAQIRNEAAKMELDEKELDLELGRFFDEQISSGVDPATATAASLDYATKIGGYAFGRKMRDGLQKQASDMLDLAYKTNNPALLDQAAPLFNALHGTNFTGQDLQDESVARTLDVNGRLVNIDRAGQVMSQTDLLSPEERAQKEKLADLKMKEAELGLNLKREQIGAARALRDQRSSSGFGVSPKEVNSWLGKETAGIDRLKTSLAKVRAELEKPGGGDKMDALIKSDPKLAAIAAGLGGNKRDPQVLMSGLTTLLQMKVQRVQTVLNKANQGIPITTFDLFDPSDTRTGTGTGTGRLDSTLDNLKGGGNAPAGLNSTAQIKKNQDAQIELFLSKNQISSPEDKEEVWKIVQRLEEANKAKPRNAVENLKIAVEMFKHEKRAQFEKDLAKRAQFEKHFDKQFLHGVEVGSMRP